jgi:hypothetical protein
MFCVLLLVLHAQPAAGLGDAVDDDEASYAVDVCSTLVMCVKC